eukprot:6103288-Pleurochrysis_carterae.AAC.4
MLEGKTCGYKLPSCEFLGGRILDNAVKRLCRNEVPLREEGLAQKSTIVINGSDDVNQNDLVNVLVGSCRGFNLQGTVKLSINDYDDAKSVAKIIMDGIPDTGALSIVQVCTDTCRKRDEGCLAPGRRALPLDGSRAPAAGRTS